MKLDRLVGERFKERPADCVIDSHALLTRGGYIKFVANGIYSSYAIMRRVTAKIEKIIREEMDAIDGQEVQFPVVMPASLWEESGRYSSVGAELMRMADRNGAGMLLGMTHEEAAVKLVREYGQSYAKYPFMVYQIQTKFRDEARPRGGLIRTREFVMKDGYSFHTSQEDLEAYYARAYRAYERICARVGLPEVVPVLSDSGMMGGSVSHEFMLLTPAGEDTVAVCNRCGYRANTDAAECVVVNEPNESEAPLTLAHTPGMKTIADVCAFLNVPEEKTCKSVVYRKCETGGRVFVFLRGDLELSETKLRNYLKEDIEPAALDADGDITAGYLGPRGLSPGEALFDNSLRGAKNLVCGANEDGYHYTGFNIERDTGLAPEQIEYHDFAKIAECCVCPGCGERSLAVSRVIELGNIFQLGDKYTSSMKMQFADSDGKLHNPVMGCYGIGVERMAASVCEARRDERGPIWPIAIAPWQVQICCVRADDANARAYADSLYERLLADGVETIYDDRTVSAGVMFSDADLIGAPLRAVISPRNMADGVCEIVTRDRSVNIKVGVDEAAGRIAGIVRNMQMDAPDVPARL